jgi:TRAP-type C4-dicarboxylate transport system permease large subunit
MLAPRTGTGFLLATFFGLITYVILNPTQSSTVAIILAMVVSVIADVFIRWRSARRLRREARRRDEAAHDADDDFWRDRR